MSRCRTHDRHGRRRSQARRLSESLCGVRGCILTERRRAGGNTGGGGPSSSKVETTNGGGDGKGGIRQSSSRGIMGIGAGQYNAHDATAGRDP